MSDVSGLRVSDIARVTGAFGVSVEQVRRDHLISLILAALHPYSDKLLFFGGTALARTHLPDHRLSEDIDLIALEDRSEQARGVVASIEGALRRTHGVITWSAPLAEIRDVDPVVLSTDDGLSVRIQLLRRTGYPAWPSERRDILQRYVGAPPVRLEVPTRDAFIAWKTSAWVDRAAPRDLYDLWALASTTGFTPGAAALFAQFGPTSGRPQSWMFTQAPAHEQWREQLAGQTRLVLTAPQALDEVRAEWRRVTRSPDWRG